VTALDPSESASLEEHLFTLLFSVQEMLRPRFRAVNDLLEHLGAACSDPPSRGLDTSAPVPVTLRGAAAAAAADDDDDDNWTPLSPVCGASHRRSR
jgi:hypothetical protein